MASHKQSLWYACSSKDCGNKASRLRDLSSVCIPVPVTAPWDRDTLDNLFIWIHPISTYHLSKLPELPCVPTYIYIYYIFVHIVIYVRCVVYITCMFDSKKITKNPTLQISHRRLLLWKTLIVASQPLAVFCHGANIAGLCFWGNSVGGGVVSENNNNLTTPNLGKSKYTDEVGENLGRMRMWQMITLPENYPPWK